jgi:DNA-binding winged helix-turn-helix (wHTH) protein
MTTTAKAYRFGPFRLDAVGYRLLRDEAPIPLSPKALDLLLLFVSRRSSRRTTSCRHSGPTSA